MKRKKNRQNDALLKFKENPKVAASLLRTIMIIVAILMVLFAIARVLREHFKIDPGPKAPAIKIESPLAYPISSDRVIEIRPLNHGLVILTENELIFLDSAGSLLRKSEHFYDNPAIVTNKSSVLLFEKGGTGYKIEKKNGLLFEGTLEKNIITAHFSDKGYYAFATSAEDATSQLIVYSKGFKEKFKWKCAAEHIVDIDISPNNKRAVVAVIGTKNAQIYSKVHIFDFKHTESLATFDFENTSTFSVNYSKRNTVLLYNSLGYHIIHGKNISRQSDYSLVNVSFIKKSNKNKTILIGSKFASNSSNQIFGFSAKGKNLFDKEVDENIKGLSCSTSAFSLILNNRIDSYNYKGGLIGSLEIEGDVIDIASASGRLYVLFSEGISVFKEDIFTGKIKT